MTACTLLRPGESVVALILASGSSVAFVVDDSGNFRFAWRAQSCLSRERYLCLRTVHRSEAK